MFAQEIRDNSLLKVPKKSKANAAEIKMAFSLIDQLTTTDDIIKFKDTYTSELMKLIKAKAKGQKLNQPASKSIVTSIQNTLNL